MKKRRIRCQNCCPGRATRPIKRNTPYNTAIGKTLRRLNAEDGTKDQHVNKETSQAGFLNTDGVSVLVLVGHCRHVKDTRDSRGDEPRTTDHAVDDDLHGRETSVVVVGFTVSKLVAWVVDNVPSNTVIQPNKDKGKTGGPGG